MPKFITAARGIVSRQKFLMIFKELFRKSIHICSAFLPFLLSKAHLPVLVLLVVALLVYSVAEIMRLNGKEIFLVSAITEAAARKRDANRFVMGPVTLCSGIICAAVLWKPLPAAIGIYALAFGDGLASLSGKLFGRVQIPFTQGKTAAGSLTCFTAIFISCYCACVAYGCQYPDVACLSLLIASAGMFIELLPLKDYDNVMIPVVLGGMSQFLIGNS